MDKADEKNKKIIAAIIADCDFKVLSKKLLKDKVAQSLTFLIDIYMDDEHKPKVHIAISGGAFSDRYSHYVYSIESFTEIMSMVYEMVCEEYPEYKDSYTQCIEDIYNKDWEA